MSLRRTKSTIISWDGSNIVLLCWDHEKTWNDKLVHTSRRPANRPALSFLNEVIAMHAMVDRTKPTKNVVTIPYDTQCGTCMSPQIHTKIEYHINANKTFIKNSGPDNPYFPNSILHVPGVLKIMLSLFHAHSRLLWWTNLLGCTHYKTDIMVVKLYLLE